MSAPGLRVTFPSVAQPGRYHRDEPAASTLARDGCPVASGALQAISRWPSSADGDDSGLAQKLGHGHLKAFERARPGPLAAMPAANRLAGPGSPVPDLNRSGFGINRILPHTGRRVEIALVNAVAPARTRRADRDNHIDGSEFVFAPPLVLSAAQVSVNKENLH